MQSHKENVYKQAQKIIHNQIKHQQIKLSKLQVHNLTRKNTQNPNTTKIQVYPINSSNIFLKDSQSSPKSQNLFEKCTANRSMNQDFNDSNVSRKVQERISYYQQEQIKFQKKKEDFKQKNKTVDLNEAYNSISDISDTHQILSNIRKLKHQDRKRLIDRINQRKTQVQQIKEQAMYYKHRDILSFFKNKFLSIIQKKKQIISDDFNVDFKTSEEDQQIYEKFKNVSRLFNWTNGIEKIKDQKRLIDQKLQADQTRNLKHNMKINSVFENYEYFSSKSRNNRSQQKVNFKQLNKNLYENEVKEQINSFLEQNTNDHQKLAANRISLQKLNNQSQCSNGVNERSAKSQSKIIETFNNQTSNWNSQRANFDIDFFPATTSNQQSYHRNNKKQKNSFQQIVSYGKSSYEMYNDCINSKYQLLKSKRSKATYIPFQKFSKHKSQQMY